MPARYLLQGKDTGYLIPVDAGLQQNLGPRRAAVKNMVARLVDLVAAETRSLPGSRGQTIP